MNIYIHVCIRMLCKKHRCRQGPFSYEITHMSERIGGEFANEGRRDLWGQRERAAGSVRPEGVRPRLPCRIIIYIYMYIYVYVYIYIFIYMNISIYSYIYIYIYI